MHVPREFLEMLTLATFTQNSDASRHHFEWRTVHVWELESGNY